MLWESELNRLGSAKRLVIAESDRLRAALRNDARRLTEAFSWLEYLRRFGGIVRPVFWLTTALVGYRGASRRSRLVRGLGLGWVLARKGLRWVRRLRS